MLSKKEEVISLWITSDYKRYCPWKKGSNKLMITSGDKKYSR